MFGLGKGIVGWNWKVMSTVNGKGSLFLSACSLWLCATSITFTLQGPIGLHSLISYSSRECIKTHNSFINKLYWYVELKKYFSRILGLLQRWSVLQLDHSRHCVLWLFSVYKYSVWLQVRTTWEVNSSNSWPCDHSPCFILSKSVLWERRGSSMKWKKRREESPLTA